VGIAGGDGGDVPVGVGQPAAGDDWLWAVLVASGGVIAEFLVFVAPV
jgi:hypothetical protein